MYPDTEQDVNLQNRLRFLYTPIIFFYTPIIQE